MTLEEKKALLEENWHNVRKRVILPLWNGKFKKMYEGIKLDYDDFESLAGFELSKAMESFDPEKSNLLTYSTRVVSKKAMTELRDCTQRDIRKTLYVSESVDVLDKSIIDNIPIKCPVFFESEREAFSPKMKAYLNRLSKLQKSILFAISEGYSNDEIMVKLQITPKEMSDAYSAIKSYRNISILF